MEENYKVAILAELYFYFPKEYSLLQNYLRNTCNFSFDYVGYKFSKLLYSEDRNASFEKNTAMIIHDYTLLSSKYLPENYGYTTAIDYSDSIILSGAPKHIFTISLTSYFSCDFSVVVGMVISLLAVSLITAIDTERNFLRISKTKGRKARRKKSGKFLRKSFSKTAWIMSITLIQKHTPEVPNLVATRIVTATWLVTVLTFTSLTNVLFRTTMSFPVYLQVDQLEDVRLKPHAIVNIMKNSPDYMYLSHQAEIDEKTKTFLEKVKLDGGLIGESDTYSIKLFEDIHNDEKILLTDTRHFSRVKLVILDQINSKMDMYLSQKHPRSKSVFYLIRKTLPSQLKDGINVGLMSIFERKPFHDVVQKYLYQFNRHAWVRPTEDNLSMDMSNFYGAFSMMAIGVLLSIVVWIVELIVFVTSATPTFQFIVNRREYDFYFKP